MNVISRRTLLITGLIAGLAGCTTSAPSPAKGRVASTKDVTAEALPMVNALRKAKGLAPLQIQAPAVGAAIFQAERMVKAQKMAHLLGAGDSFFQRMKVGNVPLPASENVAAGQQSVSAVVDAWSKSKHHMENMVGNYASLGVAVAYDATANNRPYWAMILSR
jgi:uncharacterized protein YkwD